MKHNEQVTWVVDYIPERCRKWRIWNVADARRTAEESIDYAVQRFPTCRFRLVKRTTTVVEEVVCG